MIEESIVYRLKNTAAISAIVVERIYPHELPQEWTLPAITYQRVSTNRTHDIGGPIGTLTARVQVDCWADTYSAAKNLGDKVRLALDGFKGTIDDNSDIGGIYLDGEREIFETVTRVYRVSLDFMIPHGETTS